MYKIKDTCSIGIRVVEKYLCSHTVRRFDELIRLNYFIKVELIISFFTIVSQIHYSRSDK